MKLCSAIAALALLAASCPTYAGPCAPIGPDTLLRAESDLSQLPVLTSNRVFLQSSYDRTGGNGDSGNFLATVNNTAVLADMKGPGAVVRIWSANPQGTFKVYIDDNPVPVITMPFAQLFDNSTAPFLAPISGQSSGGYYSYVPITYAKHCVITTGVLGFYYQVNYLSFAAGTAVRPFSLPLSASDQAALGIAQAAWSSSAIAPASLPGLARTRVLQPLSTMVLGRYKGPAVIKQIRLALPDVADADLRKVVLRAYFDDHKVPDVEAPVADFFGDAYGRKQFGSLLIAQAADGTFESRLPMPFGRTAVFTIESGLTHPAAVGWSVDKAVQPFSSATTGYCHATWNEETTTAGKPHTWLRVLGERGELVGIVQAMNGEGLGYLEGDDQIRVDEQTWTPTPLNPSTVIGPWNGTGTEDCFNSGWYFDGGPNILPMNGALMRTDSGKIDCYRWLLNDSPTFQSSIDAQIEHGGENDDPGVNYSSVAFWYSDGPMQEVAPFPRAKDIAPPTPPKPLVNLPYAIEGESLIGQATGGSATVQDMYAFGKSWSGDAQLFWHGGQINDQLTLTLTPPAAGEYDLVGYFTKASDYGVVTFKLNGAPLGTAFDGYHNGVVASGPVDLGLVTLPAGPSTLQITITSKNPVASNTFFGLDALCLNPPGSSPVPIPGVVAGAS